MADKDDKKPLSSNSGPYRILRELFAPYKLSSNPSDDEDKLSTWRQDEALSNESKSEEDDQRSAEDEKPTMVNGRHSLSAVSSRGSDEYQEGDDIRLSKISTVFDLYHYSSLPQHDPCDSSSGATEGVSCGIETVENDSEADSVQLDHFACDRVSSVTLNGPNCTFKLEHKIVETLLKHQLDGLKWLWSLHCQGKGGILGDEMGLGKTRQICCFLAGLFNSRLIKKALVVVPKTLLPHWIKELSAVGLSEKTRGYHGTCKKAREEGLFQVTIS